MNLTINREKVYFSDIPFSRIAEYTSPLFQNSVSNILNEEKF